MDKKYSLFLCLLALPLGACLSGEGKARIHRIADPYVAAESDATEQEEPLDQTQTVRLTYGYNVIMPPRYAPYYFCEQQRLGVEKLPEAVRNDYARFCKKSTYPHTVDTWVNNSALAASGKRQVVIRLADQRGLFLVDGCPAMDFPVCTGSTDRPTPTGRFEVLEKDPDHHSNLYNNAPMQCFMRLTWDGVGMHIGLIAGLPDSHGCIRLPERAAHLLYARAPIGMPVRILP